MKLNLTGQRFGRLVALKDCGRNQQKQVIWECLCDCGKTTSVVSSKLKNGHTKSCGCLHRDVLKEQETTHGQSNTSLYRKWREIKNRCYNPNSTGYANYGGRGIKMCKEWQSFERFRDDYPSISGEGNSIDRIDVDGDYCLENCRKANRRTQALNTRRSGKIISLIPVYRILFELSQNKEYFARVLKISARQVYTLHELAFNHEELQKHSTQSLLEMSKQQIEELL